MEPEQVDGFAHWIGELTNGSVTPGDGGTRYVEVPAPATPGQEAGGGAVPPGLAPGLGGPLARTPRAPRAARRGRKLKARGRVKIPRCQGEG